MDFQIHDIEHIHEEHHQWPLELERKDPPAAHHADVLPGRRTLLQDIESSFSQLR